MTMEQFIIIIETPYEKPLSYHFRTTDHTCFYFWHTSVLFGRLSMVMDSVGHGMFNPEPFRHKRFDVFAVPPPWQNPYPTCGAFWHPPVSSRLAYLHNAAIPAPTRTSMKTCSEPGQDPVSVFHCIYICFPYLPWACPAKQARCLSANKKMKRYVEYWVR